MNFLDSTLLGIINGIYSVIPNYAVAIMIFTLLIKLLVTPLDLKSRQSMQRMAKLNPKLEVLKKKYGDDQEKLNKKTQELYAREKINPLAGCLPLLISMPILFAMFGATRTIGNEQIVKQFLLFQANPAMDITTITEPFLWIKNLWMPDTPFHTILPDLSSLQMIDFSVWNRVSAQLAEGGLIPAALNLADKAAMTTYIADVVSPFMASAEYAPYLTAIPGLENISLLFFSITVYKDFNGMYILPILAVVSQLLMQKLTAKQQGAAATQQGGNQNMMMYMFSFMSLWFCTTSTSAFSIYWVFSNIFGMVQQFAFAKYFAWQDRKAATAQEVGIK